MRYALLSGLLAAGLLAGAGCISAPRMQGSPATGQGRARGYREFFVRPGITQFFLLPLRLNGPARRRAELDLVVRDSAAVPISGLLHISFTEPDGTAFGPQDTLLLETVGRPLRVAAPRILYSEGKNQARTTRLEVRLSPAQLTAYLQAPDHDLFVKRPGVGQLMFEATKKSQAALQSFAAAVGSSR